MNGRTFLMIFKEAKVIDNHLLITSIETIFDNIKTKGKMKINYDQFVKGIKLSAIEKQCEYLTLSNKICMLKGPSFKGTKT